MTADGNDALASSPFPSGYRPPPQGTAYAAAACCRGGGDAAGDDGGDDGDGVADRPFPAVMAAAAVEGLAGGVKQNQIFLDQVRGISLPHNGCGNSP